MLDTVKENLFFSGMAFNLSSTVAVFFHWFSAVFRLMLVLMLSSIFLLTIPSSLFAGLIRRDVGEVFFTVFKSDVKAC